MKKFSHKKSLGQNFLSNREIIDHIVTIAQITVNDVVLEIGPGQGDLTAALAQKAQRVIAVELDDRLISVLKSRFDTDKKVHIVHADILKVNFSDLAALHKLRARNYAVVANIPYYITAPIIRFFLEQTSPPRSMTLMVQKEVAERLCALPGQMSILSVAAQYYADVSYGFTVSRREFDPVPAVDSAVVHLVIKKPNMNNAKNVFRIVKIGFSARRKTLCNNLANGLHRPKKDIVEILHACALYEDVRAQDLSVDQWITLTQHLCLEER